MYHNRVNCWWAGRIKTSILDFPIVAAASWKLHLGHCSFFFCCCVARNIRAGRGGASSSWGNSERRNRFMDVRHTKKNPKWLTHCCWFDEYSNDTSCRYMQIDVCVLPTLNAASDRTRKCISFLKNRLQEKQHEKHFCWQNAHNFILGRNMVHQKLLCDTRLSRRNELMLWCYETRGVQAWRWFTL